MKNIIIFDTSIGSLNQGDEIINKSMEKNWPELYEKNYTIKIASHQPVYTIFQNIYNRKKFKVLKDADYKFLIGTNALYTNMLRPLPNWNIRLWNTGILKNTILVGVGIGENSKRINLYTKLLYRRVLSKEYIHSTRDQKTCDFLQKLGYKAINTGCPTLWGLTKDLCQSIPESKCNDVIFTLTSSFKDKINDKKMINIIEKRYKKIYFWAQNINDIEYLKELTNSDRIIIIPSNLKAFDKILNTRIDYIGNRLHGGIYAMQHKCRSIIIAIDYRAAEMSKDFSFKCIDRNNIEKELDELICSNWKTDIKGLDFDKIEEFKKQFLF